MRRLSTLTLTIGLILGSTCSASAKVFKNQRDALSEVFADCDTVIRNTLFLTDEQVEQVQQRAGVKVASKIASYYTGVKGDSAVGFAFFETNIVRTKTETIMVVISPDARVLSVEMLAFYEPQDYLPTPNWFHLFIGKFLNNSLWPKRDIHAVTGATLTVRSVTRGVRKQLAIYEVAILQEDVQ